MPQVPCLGSTTMSSPHRGLMLAVVFTLGALMLEYPMAGAQEVRPDQQGQPNQPSQGRRGWGGDRPRGGGMRGPEGVRGPGASRGPGADRGTGRDRGPEGNRGAGRDRGPGGNRGPGGDRGFGRGGPPGPFTPEMVEQFYVRVSEGHLRRLTDIYALTEDQRAQVRQQLDTIKQQQREYSQPIMRDVQTMMRERFALEGQRRAGQAIDENRLQQVTDWLRQARNQSPLMNFENVADAVEKTLPADQVTRAQQRRSASKAEEDARSAERQRRRQEMRAQRDAQRQLEQQQQAQQPVPQPVQPEQSPSGDASQAQDSQLPSDNRGAEQGARPDRPQRRQRAVTQEQSVQDSGQVQDEQDRMRSWRERARESRGTGDPWDDYVIAFIRRYHLDDSQQSSAHSLLRMYKDERRQYRDARKLDYAAAEKIENDQKRHDEIERLNKGIDRLFEVLKERLERIPTDSQIAQYGSRRRPTGERDSPTSRPAPDSQQDRPAQSQPAASAGSQPV